MADSTINGLTELGTLKENDLMIAWEADAPTNQTKKITAKNARKFSIMEAVCNSAADATTKEIIINANAIPERIAVTFTHGNTAGDTTQQGFTPLKLSIAYNGGSADFDICDSLGNYAGKGFGGGVDGGIIIFQLLSTKALITNSDIRQKDTNYVIKSDGSIKQCFIALPNNGYIYFPKPFKDDNVIVNYTYMYHGDISQLTDPWDAKYFIYSDVSSSRFKVVNPSGANSFSYNVIATGRI